MDKEYFLFQVLRFSRREKGKTKGKSKRAQREDQLTIPIGMDKRKR